ncbi:MAG: hypothetical protein JRN20_16635 [Nitrososphaerota archaeon]|nr:hypothetical protein [Nitrososphaerota archaeon]
MITLQTKDISEKQLAEIALAIQNRWEVPTFVKIHEIVVIDEDVEKYRRDEITKNFDRGLETILENLELSAAFEYEKIGKNKFKIARIAGSHLPSWMEEIEKAPRVPDGMFECPHCGKLFNTDMEMSLHTKLHYII